MQKQDLFDKVKLFLSYLPPYLQFPPVYFNIKRLIKNSDTWNPAKIQEWQFLKFKLILDYAYKNVKGYHQLYNEHKIKPNDIQIIKDIKLLPFVSKEILRDNLELFTSSKIPKWRLKYITTGGSTGIPFGFYTTVRNYFIETAFMHSAWETTGWKYGDLSAMLRGLYIGSEKDFFKYEKFNNILYLSNYYLTEKSYPKYYEIVSKFNPTALQAYPSAATRLSDFILQNEDSGKWKFDILFLGSENLYGWQKEKIKKAFPESKMFSWYGHAEKVIFAPACQKSDLLHISPMYGFTEILDMKNEEAGIFEKGELVGTSFWNFATPFIRYKTADLAVKSHFGCDECGKNHQLLSRIEGRIHEFIISKNNRYISMTSINMHDNIFDKLKQFQFYQEVIGKVIFKFIPKEHLNQSEIDQMIAKLKPKLGDDFEITAIEVSEISTNKSGKFTFLEQKIDLKYRNEYE